MQKIRWMSLLCTLLVIVQLALLAIPAVAAGNTESVGLNEEASIIGDAFRFFSPKADDTNLLTTKYSKSGVGHATSTTVPTTSIEVAADPKAYVAFKLKNTTNAEVEFAVQLGLQSGVTRAAGVLWPLAYDTVTGEKLEYTLNTTANRASGTARGIKLASGAEIYFVVPLVSVDATDTLIPGMVQTNAETGTLTASAADSSTLQTQFQSRGILNFKELRVWCFKSGGGISFEISEVYAMDMDEYTERYNEFDFAMQTGASVRINAPTGLRFSAIADSNDYDYLIRRYGAENVSMGTIITPKSYAANAGAMTFEALNALTGVTTKYLDVTADEFYKKEKNSFVVAGSIVGLKNAYDFDYTAVCYIKVTDGNSVFYLYAADPQTRNISYVANAAVHVDRVTEKDEENGYIYEINDGNANGAWSCYNADEIALLKAYIVE